MQILKVETDPADGIGAGADGVGAGLCRAAVDDVGGILTAGGGDPLMGGGGIPVTRVSTERLLQFMTEATSMMLPAIEDGVLPFHAILWNSDTAHNHRRIL